jgi:excisionase family DNA binding protein
MASDLIDSRVAASELGVSVRRVQQLIGAGRLPAEVIGGTFVIRRADLKLVRDRKPGRPPKIKRKADRSGDAR